MLSGWRASERMFSTPASRLSVPKERHSDMMCLIVRRVPQLAYIYLFEHILRARKWVFLLNQVLVG